MFNIKRKKKRKLSENQEESKKDALPEMTRE